MDKSYKFVYIYKYHGSTVPDCVEIYDVHADSAEDARRIVINDYFKHVDKNKWYRAYIEDPSASSFDNEPDNSSEETAEDAAENAAEDAAEDSVAAERILNMIVSNVEKFNDTNFGVDCRCEGCYVVFREADASHVFVGSSKTLFPQ